jgi:hypothetical protein
MTATRDPDRLIQAFLEEGPAVMTDRVLDAIREDVDETDQRAGIGPWRTIPMLRPILAAAAVVAAVAIGLVAYSAFGPNIGSDPPPPEPTPIPEAFPADGPLAVGTTYVVADFGEPVTFTVPSSLSETDVLGDISDAGNFRVDAWDYGIVTFHDDVQIVDDVCNPTSAIQLPASSDDVATWLAGADGATVSDPMELTVAGRPALAFDVALGGDCVSGGDQPVSGTAFWFQAGEHHRIYAIPTDDDMILGVTWGTSSVARARSSSTPCM